MRFASKRDRMYTAWPRQSCRWTAQSSAVFSARRYSDLNTADGQLADLDPAFSDRERKCIRRR